MSMSIEDQDSVDVIGVNESGIVVLTISDHLKWDDDHLYLLQEKINTYLAMKFMNGIMIKAPL